MIIEPKIQDPLKIRLGNHGSDIMKDEYNEDIPLIPGATIGGEHFGFTLIADKNGKQTEITYPTQCRITAVGIENNLLLVFEKNKYVAWKFQRNGTLICEAKFLATWRPDCEFLAKAYGIVTKEEIEEINSYRKKRK